MALLLPWLQRADLLLVVAGQQCGVLFLLLLSSNLVLLLPHHSICWQQPLRSSGLPSWTCHPLFSLHLIMSVCLLTRKLTQPTDLLTHQPADLPSSSPDHPSHLLTFLALCCLLLLRRCGARPGRRDPR